jgi:hypothetical protein
MTIADWAIILATLAGPVLAVQAQKWLERIREQDGRRLTIFRTLMATRAANLSPSHVEALNAIPIEFYGPRKSHKDVVEAWRAYLDHLGKDQGDGTLWGQKRFELFIELLWRLALALRYRFTKLELQREVYSPQAHARIEHENDVIRSGLFKVFNGEAALPLDVKSLPTDPEFVVAQVELQQRFLSWLRGEQPVKVALDESATSGESKGRRSGQPRSSTADIGR